MTTIAYRDGVLAADTLATAGGVRAGYTLKVSRLYDGTLVGFAGRVACLGAVLRAAEEAAKAAGRAKTSLFSMDGSLFPVWPKEEYLLLCITPDGSVGLNEGGDGFISLALDGGYVAEGSGGLLATVAMDCGLSACEAVKAAIRRDTSSGGDVYYLELGGEGEPKKYYTPRTYKHVEAQIL